MDIQMRGWRRQPFNGEAMRVVPRDVEKLSKETPYSADSLLHVMEGDPFVYVVRARPYYEEDVAYYIIPIGLVTFHDSRVGDGEWTPCTI